MIWEYKLEKVVEVCHANAGFGMGGGRPADTVSTIQKRLEDLGKEGWELIAIAPPPPDPCNPRIIGLYYFKRPAAPVGTPLPAGSFPEPRMKLLGEASP